MAIIAGEEYAAEGRRILFANAEAAKTFQMFAVHDADPFGYNIARTLREETERMQGYRANVVDLGLTLEDALARGLPLEKFTRRKAIPAGLVLNDLERQHFDGRQVSFGKTPSWICQRIELNAFTAPDLIACCDSKLAASGVRGKLVPPQNVLAQDLDDAVKEGLRQKIEADILREADVYGRAAAAHQALRSVIERHSSELRGAVTGALEAGPGKQWCTPVADNAAARNGSASSRDEGVH